MKKTIAFTGHRPGKLLGYKKADNYNLLIEAKRVIKEEIEKGTTTFITGMALGVDLWLAEIVLDFRDRKYPHLKVTAAIPCIGQESKWPESSQNYYKYILERCNRKLLVTKGTYEPWMMDQRNMYMVDNSDGIIAVWNGTSGGTANCIKYADKKKKDIIFIGEEFLK